MLRVLLRNVSLNIPHPFKTDILNYAFLRFGSRTGEQSGDVTTEWRSSVPISLSRMEEKVPSPIQAQKSKLRVLTAPTLQ